MAELPEQLKHSLCDFRLAAVAWSEDGSDILLTLRSPTGAATPELRIRLEWVTDLAVHIDFGTYAGMPLLLGSQVEQLPTGRWVVELQFGAAPEGTLRCECDAITLS